MSRDELEYAISQYIDGNLPLLERNALEERLAVDAEARALLQEYREFSAALKQAIPVPEIAWERLAAQIHQSLESEEAPIRHYSLRSVSWVGRLAIAASVLLAISLAVHFSNRPSASTESAGVALVSGPQIEQPKTPVIAEISIGPSASVAANSRASEEIISRPTVVLIDQAHISGQDNESSIY